MSEQLKACPFCGGAPALEDHRLIWAVRCGCGVCMLGERAPEPTRAMSEKYWRRFEQSAVDAWNRRAQDFDTLAQRLQEAERLLGEATALLQEAETALFNVNCCSNNCQDCAGTAGEQASKIETFLAVMQKKESPSC